MADTRVPMERPTPDGNGRIMFVAEAPGKEEVGQGRPLVGASGRELNKMLRAVGILRTDCALTNVFDFKLDKNSVKSICVNKKELDASLKETDPAGLENIVTKYIERGQYLPPEHWAQLERLRDEIEDIRPNLIVPLGATALWAVCGQNGIKLARGTVTESALCPGIKALPTFHPAHVLRNYPLRITLIADLMKAKNESRFPEIRHPEREMWLRPDYDDLLEFEKLIRAASGPVGCDIETRHGQITCIGFAPDNKHAMVVPLCDLDAKGNILGNYWKDTRTELNVMLWLQRILEDPDVPLLFQNGTYDIQHIANEWGIRTFAYREDTRLLHHALYPELKKDLGLLGSWYENEAAWKSLGGKAQKRDA